MRNKLLYKSSFYSYLEKSCQTIENHTFLLDFFHPILSIHGATLAKRVCCGGLIPLNNTNGTSVGKDKAQIGRTRAAALC